MIQDHFDVETWERVAFGKVVQNKNENTSNPSLEGLSRVVGLDHMDSESLPLVRWSELDDLPDGTTFTRRFHAGQVLFGKRRSYQKKVSFPDFDGVCSGDILVFQSLDSKRLLPGFLPLLVQSDPFTEFAISTSAGSLSPRTKWSDLAKFEFFLPSLNNQEEIVEIISAIDKVIEGYRKLSVRSYWESIVHELLSAGGDDWSDTTLGAVAEASWGNTTVTKKQYRESGFTAFSASGPDGYVEWFEHDGEGVVLSAIGALCGKTWLASCRWTPIKNTIWIKSKSEECLTGYLFLISKMPDLWPIRGQAQPFISLGDVRLVAVSLPPLSEQKQIVEIVSSVDDVFLSAEQSIADAKALRSSILGEVFKEHSHA